MAVQIKDLFRPKINHNYKPKNLADFEKGLLDFLDNTFCKFALKDPHGVKLFFKKFFKHNNLYSLVRFLTNSANLLEILKIIITYISLV